MKNFGHAVAILDQPSINFSGLFLSNSKKKEYQNFDLHLSVFNKYSAFISKNFIVMLLIGTRILLEK